MEVGCLRPDLVMTVHRITPHTVVFSTTGVGFVCLNGLVLAMAQPTMSLVAAVDNGQRFTLCDVATLRCAVGVLLVCACFCKYKHAHVSPRTHSLPCCAIPLAVQLMARGKFMSSAGGVLTNTAPVCVYCWFYVMHSCVCVYCWCYVDAFLSVCIKPCAHNTSNHAQATHTQTPHTHTHTHHTQVACCTEQHLLQFPSVVNAVNTQRVQFSTTLWSSSGTRLVCCVSVLCICVVYDMTCICVVYVCCICVLYMCVLHVLCMS